VEDLENALKCIDQALGFDQFNSELFFCNGRSLRQNKRGAMKALRNMSKQARKTHPACPMLSKPSLSFPSKLVTKRRQPSIGKKGEESERCTMKLPIYVGNVTTKYPGTRTVSSATWGFGSIKLTLAASEHADNSNLKCEACRKIAQQLSFRGRCQMIRYCQKKHCLTQKKSCLPKNSRSDWLPHDSLPSQGTCLLCL
jgi:hypothetical protein